MCTEHTLLLFCSSCIQASLSCNTEKVWGCCPSTWMSFDSSCYFISTEKNSQTRFEQNCVGMGGHLVVINTEVEQNFIVQQLNKSLPYFLGLSDPQGKNNWQWIDQTPYKENLLANHRRMFLPFVSFRFWHEKEPNFSGEQCVVIVFWTPGKWGWNDVFCDLKMNLICEMKKIYL
ncbi:LOW QUALITY PROTEIN: C-type lectin domain family 6 member A-like [Trichechus inunguis]